MVMSKSLNWLESRLCGGGFSICESLKRGMLASNKSEA